MYRSRRELSHEYLKSWLRYSRERALLSLPALRVQSRSLQIVRLTGPVGREVAQSWLLFGRVCSALFFHFGSRARSRATFYRRGGEFGAQKTRRLFCRRWRQVEEVEIVRAIVPLKCDSFVQIRR